MQSYIYIIYVIYSLWSQDIQGDVRCTAILQWYGLLFFQQEQRLRVSYVSEDGVWTAHGHFHGGKFSDEPWDEPWDFGICSDKAPSQGRILACGFAVQFRNQHWNWNLDMDCDGYDMIFWFFLQGHSHSQTGLLYQKNGFEKWLGPSWSSEVGILPWHWSTNWAWAHCPVAWIALDVRGPLRIRPRLSCVVSTGTASEKG